MAKMLSKMPGYAWCNCFHCANSPYSISRKQRRRIARAREKREWLKETEYRE